MHQTSFSDLASSLDGSGLEGAGKDAFSIPESAGFFVEPVLVVKEGFDDLASDVVLISARGAAGKSRTAVELAMRAKAPLWSLERDAAVGSAALPLNLNTYMGAVNAIEEIAERPVRPTLLVDSLDEARSRVSAQSWEEFLDSISDAGGRGLRLVLFGRDRTLEDVWLKLADAGRSIAWLEVSHFPPESRIEYINGRVVERDSTASTDGQYYVAARDALLDALTGSVDAESAETFVGYAPVLDAVATVLLDEQNHYKLAQEFGAKAGNSRHIEVLREILDGLLTRDQGKLKPLANELGLDAQSIFTPHEQIEWLWHDIVGTPEPGLLHIVDEAKRFEYRQKLRSFLDEHPFRSERRWASAVFEAYAAAEWFDRSLPPDGLLDVGNRSGLLFDFVATSAGEDERVLDEWQFAALHSSILAGESAGSAATVTATQSEDVGLEGSMEVTRPSGPLSLRFTLLPADSDEVVLVGPLESLTLSTPGGVRIPPLESGKVIGPDLFLQCRSLHVEGNEARFARTASTPGEEAAEVRFDIRGNSVVLPSLISVEPTTDAFEIALPESAQIVYPWTKFRVAPEAEAEEVDPRSKAIRFLHKLQSLARTHGHSDGRATFFMKLQGRQPIKSVKLRDTLDRMVARGVVRLDGELVFLTAEADQHRFSGKGMPGQRTIDDEWDYWGPIVQDIESLLDAS